MNVVFHKNFQKMFKRLPKKIQGRVGERIELFANDPLDSQLRNHSINVPYKDSRSIDITGDYRAIYKLVDKETALFTHVGTHSQLYR
ncbi:MAG: type II toxin-antitoxin system RelE/ParE family toxin [Candidatus Saccharimonadales bacterium]